MRKLASVLGLFAALCAIPAAAQTQFPTTLPSNSVWGRLGIGAGPGQAIPFNVLTGGLFQGASGAFTCTIAGVCTINSGVVTNSDLANMAGGTLKCNPFTTPTSPQDCSSSTINVKDLGAACDGVTNDATVINNALASAVSGQTVLLPFGKTCKVNSSINIGNGSASAASTVNGVILGCQANPISTSYFGGMSATTGCRLLYGGIAAAGVINVLGPIQGWGINNIYIDCASTADVGVKLVSAQGGGMQNYVVNNCLTQGILTNTVPQGAGPIFGDSNTENNLFINGLVNVPNVASVIGIQLTGQSTDTTSNTSHNTFINTKILLPLATTAMIGIDLQDADSDVFYGTFMFGGGSGCTGVVFDYSNHNAWPASESFFGLDTGKSNCTTSFSNNSTPGSATPNYVYGLSETNGSACIALNNFACFSSHNMFTSPGGNVASTDILGVWTAFTPTPTCGTATFTVNSARAKIVGKTTHFQLDATISTLGTCTTSLSFTLPSTLNFTNAIIGEVISTGKLWFCALSGGASSATGCEHTDATNWVAADRFVMTGIYENQ